MNLTLCLFGEVVGLFNKQGKFVGETDQELKYTILQLPGQTDYLIMLVHLQQEPMEYHADAIMFYMAKKNIDKLQVRGGGYLMMRVQRTRQACFESQSSDYGFPAKDELRAFRFTFWSTFKLDDYVGKPTPSIKEVAAKPHLTEGYDFDTDIFKLVEVSKTF